ncbi:MAG TPA: cohesin domain-containing protein [Gemmataceae bacterium]|nr:cohesin domain-containing protein [Gemmataceae bacterium]
MRRRAVPCLEELESRLLLRSPFEAPSLGPPPNPGPGVVWVSTVTELQSAVRNLQSNQTIVIRRGTYNLTETLIVGRSGPISNVTIRGETDNFDDVILRGRGMDNPNYGSVPHGISIWNAQDVLLANFSIGEVWYHPIDLQGGAGAERIRIYHVRAFNGGEQLVKSNPAADGTGVDDSILEYSILEYTDGTPTIDHGGGLGYTGGLHAHRTNRWIIRHNLFRNFHTPDSHDFRYNPVVLMWNYSRDTIVEGNTFVNCDRAVALGLVDQPDGFDHQGGIVRNNFIWIDPGLFSASRRAGADTQIAVYDSPDTKVYHNTVLTNGNTPRSIEVRWATSGVEIFNNLTDAPIGARNGGLFTAGGNYTGATLGMFADPANHDLHLVANAATLANVVDKVSPLAETDWDDGPRPSDDRADIGADELRDPDLHVTSFTPTNTGFTVPFNRAVDAAVLNLYDTQAGGLGPADVTLVGRATGPVRGSLVIDPALTRVRFVKTGSVLAPDVYTVTLRSAVDGFQALATGQRLDGNGDGIAGDDFITTFTVAASSAVTVSIPDLARGPGQPLDLGGAEAGLPLRLSNGSGVTSVSLVLRYDPRLLTVQGASPAAGLPAGTTVSLTVSTPGAAVLTFTSPTALPAGPLNFVMLTAVVPDTAPYASKQVLDLANIRINNGAIAAVDDDGLHVVGYPGDATGNTRYSAADALRVLRVAVGLDAGFAAFQLADPTIIADVTGNGAVNAADATRLLQEALGLDRSEVPPLPANLPLIVPGGPDPLLNLPKGLQGRRGRIVVVPVNLDISDRLESADLALSYDTTRLELLAVERGSLTADFDLFAVRLDPERGTVRVGLGRTAGPISGRGGGSVVQITFRVKDGAPAGRAVINLRSSLDVTRTQLNEGRLDLNPDPSDTAGDPLDGVVTVPRRTERIDAFFRSYGRTDEDRPSLAGLIAVLAKRPRRPRGLDPIN